MGNEDLSAVNPLRALLAEGSGAEETRNMGLIMARAGLGKTQFLFKLLWTVCCLETRFFMYRLEKV